MRDHVLAIDIGTSSCRAIVFSTDGLVVATQQEIYDVLMPKPGWQEQDPDVIFDAVIRTVGACLSQKPFMLEKLAGIGFSSQMYSVFPVDTTGKPLLHSIIWADSRSEKQADALREEFGFRYFYEKTSCPHNSIYPLAKIRWIREEEPEIFAKAARFISIKDYVLEKFIGRYVADFSSASASGLVNIFDHVWEKRALDAIGITTAQLPELADVMSIYPFSNKALAATWGIPINLPVVIGAGDGPLANLGSGATDVGDINIDFGTSGAARTIVKNPSADEKGRLWCYGLTKDTWALGGILNNVGNLYQWFAESIVFYGVPKGSADLNYLNKLAADCPAGANGLYFLPFIRKARSPYWDNDLRGTIYGLNPSHDLRHISRAMVEGVAFNMKSIVDALRENTPVRGRTLFTGGLSQAEVWGQTLSNVLGERLLLPSSKEGSAGGAAILAMFALGLKTKLEPLSGQKELSVYEPDPDLYERYLRLYKNYTQVCATVKELNSRIAWD